MKSNEINIHAVAEKIAGVQLVFIPPYVEITEDIRLHRFSDDSFHILVDGAGSFKAIRYPNTFLQEVVREGHLSEFAEAITSVAQSEYVIYSPNESAISDGGGFWSNEDGWVDFTSATKFTKTESETLNLPLSTGQDAKWVLWDEANASYGGEADRHDEFQNALKVCINCMTDEDAVGNSFVFVRDTNWRNGHNLVIKEGYPDLDNLEQYEMILFDGGHIHGGLWKHVFYPRQRKHFYVDENPHPRQPADKPDGNIKVSLDGGKTYQDAPSGVRIVYQDMPIPGEDASGELHVNATEEGLIMDVWATRDEPLDHNIGTSSEMAAEIIGRLVEDGA